MWVHNRINATCDASNCKCLYLGFVNVDPPNCVRCMPRFCLLLLYSSSSCSVLPSPGSFSLELKPRRRRRRRFCLLPLYGNSGCSVLPSPGSFSLECEAISSEEGFVYCFYIVTAVVVSCHLLGVSHSSVKPSAVMVKKKKKKVCGNSPPSIIRLVCSCILCFL